MRIQELSSDALLSSLRTALGNERRLVAEVIAYLVEVETRRLHLELAFSSMFEFCIKKLGLSEGAAFRRLTAARLVRRFPSLLDAIASGRLHLSSIVLLRDLFTETNVEALVSAAAGRTKREVSELVARLAPKPDVAASMRRLPARADGPPAQTTLLGRATATAPTKDRSQPSPAVAPLAEGRYKLQFTAGSSFTTKLDRARELMSHRNPSGDIAVVLERSLDVLIDALEKQKFGKTARPRSSRRSKDRARVVSAVRRVVASRDDEQCSYRSPTGERCSERRFLEFDHRHPRARGGTGDVENIRLYCRAHNGYAAEQIFGQEFMATRVRFSRSKCGAREKPRELIAGAAPCEIAGDEPSERGTSSTPTCMPERELREVVRRALIGMGFRSKETEHSIAALPPEAWERPTEEILRTVIVRLTT